jgi:ketosteroid isomerase-like protein
MPARQRQARRFFWAGVDSRASQTSLFGKTTRQEPGVAVFPELRPPSQSHSGGNTVDKLADPILQVLSDYQAAVFAKDVDRFEALYDRDVVLFDMWAAWSCKGITSLREMTTGWFGSLGTERVIVDFSDVQATVGQDLAFVHAFVKFKAVTAEGVELRSMDNRLTMTLRQTGDGWKIVHQHTSSPIEPGTTSVIFKRG